MAADKSTLQIHVKQIPRANNLKNNAKKFFCNHHISILNTKLRYQTMAEI